MLSIALPPIAIAIIYVARMKELGARRETIPGPIHERWSLRLFLLVGTAIWADALKSHFRRAGKIQLLMRSIRLRKLQFVVVDTAVSSECGTIAEELP